MLYLLLPPFTPFEFFWTSNYFYFIVWGKDDEGSWYDSTHYFWLYFIFCSFEMLPTHLDEALLWPTQVGV